MKERFLNRRQFLHGSLLASAGLILPLQKNPVSSLPESQTFLFLGDSITAGGGYVNIIATALKEASPQYPPEVINAGKSSETVSGLSEAYHPGVRPNLFDRLNDELDKAKPDWVVACYGINCGIYHPFDASRFAAYQAGIQKLINKVHAAGSMLILLTAPPYAKAGPAFPDDADTQTIKKLLAQANEAAQSEAEKDPNKFGYRTPYAYYDQVMARYASWLLTMENRKNVWVVNLREAMLPRLKDSYDSDPIHPNATGHRIMAECFLKDWSRISKQAGANTH